MIGIETTGADHRQTEKQGGVMHKPLTSNRYLKIVTSCGCHARMPLLITPVAPDTAFSSMIHSLATEGIMEPLWVKSG